MIADSDIQVWLDSQPNGGQLLMVPYVKTARNMKLTYQLKLIQNRKSDHSNVRQGGTVMLHAASATPLSRIVITPITDGECRLEVTLHEGEQMLENYSFTCPS